MMVWDLCPGRSRGWGSGLGKVGSVGICLDGRGHADCFMGVG